MAGSTWCKHPGEVRRHIGVAAQDATLDPLLTGRQNLVLVGELSDMGRADSRARAKELLAQFELTDAADRVVKGYSGGMRRRLDLAASLMTRPPVLFLDEPTTGLDPTSRQRVWEAIRELLGEGVTVLLTTQYLEEADALAHRIVVVDHGRVIADGTPQELKEASRERPPGGDAGGSRTPRRWARWRRWWRARCRVSDDGRRLRAPAWTRRPGWRPRWCGRWMPRECWWTTSRCGSRRSDDVFFSLTGGHIEEGAGRRGRRCGDGDGGGGDGAMRRSDWSRRRRRWPSRAGRSTRMTTTTLTPHRDRVRPAALGRQRARVRWPTSGP